jgi:singapore isolate B (sub-type 7) whole genome shotgun sequence assembly, scaffold_30
MSIVSGYAGDDGFKAPAEWDVHEQTWMGFPQVLVLGGDNDVET